MIVNDAADDVEAYFLTQEIFPPSSGFAKSQDDIAEPGIVSCADVGRRNRNKAPKAASSNVSDHSVAALADRLRSCLDTENADAALVAMIAEPDALAQLPRIPRTKWYDKPHSIVGLATTLMAGALIATGRSDEARRFLCDTATLFGRTDWSDERNFEAFCHRFHFHPTRKSIVFCPMRESDATDRLISTAAGPSIGSRKSSKPRDTIARSKRAVSSKRFSSKTH